MKLTVTEKRVININISLLIILFLLLGTQFVINQAGIDLRRYVNQPPATPSLPAESEENDADLTVKIPEPTEELSEEDVTDMKPRRAWWGWVLVISGSILVIGTLGVKIFKSILSGP